VWRLSRGGGQRDDEQIRRAQLHTAVAASAASPVLLTVQRSIRLP
jgi:hypothetical protein